MKKSLILITLVFNLMIVNGQESDELNSPFHKLGIVMGNHHVQKGIKNSKTEWLILSSWGLTYSYNFKSKWAIGISSDLILGDYEVKTYKADNERIIQRSYPITTAINGYFKPIKNLSILLGTGFETAEEDNFFLIKMGLDYGWEVGNDFEISISIENELKVEEYDSWSFGVTLSKKIFK